MSFLAAAWIDSTCLMTKVTSPSNKQSTAKAEHKSQHDWKCKFIDAQQQQLREEWTWSRKTELRKRFYTTPRPPGQEAEWDRKRKDQFNSRGPSTSSQGSWYRWLLLWHACRSHVPHQHLRKVFSCRNSVWGLNCCWKYDQLSSIPPAIFTFRYDLTCPPFQHV